MTTAAIAAGWSEVSASNAAPVKRLALEILQAEPDVCCNSASKPDS